LHNGQKEWHDKPGKVAQGGPRKLSFVIDPETGVEMVHFYTIVFVANHTK
jgi:hypothetical protein